MARLFDRSSDESALVDVTPVSAYPYCMGVWLRKLGGSATETLMFFGEKDVYSNAYTRLQISKFGKIQANSAHTGNLVTSVDAYDDGEWHACLLVERDASGLRHLDLYVDGTFMGTDSNANPGGLSIFNRVAFGRRMTPTPGDALDGTLAEGIIADIDPTAEQVAAWSRGAIARRIFGTSLRGDWPLWGVHSPEVDLSGEGNDLTLTGTTADDHAPVSTYTQKWAASMPASDPTTRRICIDGIVSHIAA